MRAFYCPACFAEVEEHTERCPHCGVPIGEFLARTSYVERLIRALDHPEPETPLRAAAILGRRRQREAIPALVAKVEETSDPYLAAACVEALSRIGGEEARAAVKGFAEDRRFIVRAAARKGLGLPPE